MKLFTQPTGAGAVLAELTAHEVQLIVLALSWAVTYAEEKESAQRSGLIELEQQFRAAHHQRTALANLVFFAGDPGDKTDRVMEYARALAAARRAELEREEASG